MTEIINLPQIIGEVKEVPLSSYRRIIDTYVEKVSALNQVQAIIQMGSFSTPGLSDIDLIVVLDENQVYPQWEEISLKEITKEQLHTEVIAHDVFVIPSAIAAKAEAYFYIDQQNVLYGKAIGGSFTEIQKKELQKLLASDYAIFTLEVIASIMFSKTITIRKLGLLISTMRHTLVLALDLRLISTEEKKQLTASVNTFRENVISGNYTLEEIRLLLQAFVKYLGLTIADLGSISKSKKLYTSVNLQKNAKMILKGMNPEKKFVETFFESIEIQKTRKWSRYFRSIPIPQQGIHHITQYYRCSHAELKPLYPSLNKKSMRTHSVESNTCGLRRERTKVALAHWRFLDATGYSLASGVAYIGLSKPIVSSFKETFKRNLTSILGKLNLI